jgi:hypothetical protein
MALWVDAAIHKTSGKGRVKHCHLLADTPEELHAFAEKAGIKRFWFHRSRKGVPHYDLNPENRLKAIRSGAVVK